MNYLECFNYFLEQSADCPTSPSDLICLSNRECNRCMRNSGSHEGCNAYSSNPVCDVDSMVNGIDDSGTRKLAECVPCKKTSKYDSENGYSFAQV